jgi:hypothetical protein
MQSGVEQLAHHGQVEESLRLLKSARAKGQRSVMLARVACPASMLWLS